MSEMLTIKKKIPKTTKTGKSYTSVVDQNGTWYSIWDTMVDARIEEGKTYDLVVETKGDFHNITGIASNVVDINDDQVSPLADIFTDEPAPIAKPAAPAPSKLEREMGTIIDERKHGIYCATLLCAAGKIGIEQMPAVADKIIAYIQGSSSTKTTTAAVEKVGELDPADFIK